MAESWAFASVLMPVGMAAAMLIPKPCSQFKVIYDDIFASEKHRCRSYSDHPERPERCRNAAAALYEVDGVSWAVPSALESEEGKERAWKAIERVHRDWYVDDIIGICARGGGDFDSDTFLSRGTVELCVAAQSAWLDAVDSALGDGVPAFALSRPPGHHATAGGAMGFCIFNFAAAAAFYALEACGAKRVAVLDYDVHHGNGVASLIREEPRIRYCSLHCSSIFPFTGATADTGPLGNILNLPFDDAGVTWEDDYEERFRKGVDWLREFSPDLLVVCAGYDALATDDVAGCRLRPEDYGHMSQMLRKEFAGVPMVFGLEGGYDIVGMPLAAVATVTPFLEPAGVSAAPGVAPSTGAA